MTKQNITRLPSIDELEQALELAFNTPIRIVGAHKITISGDEISLSLKAKLTNQNQRPDAKETPEEAPPTDEDDTEYDPLKSRPPSSREKMMMQVILDALPDNLTIEQIRNRYREAGGDMNNFKKVIRNLRKKDMIFITPDRAVHVKHFSD